jgi:hypothetical protein
MNECLEEDLSGSEASGCRCLGEPGKDCASNSLSKRAASSHVLSLVGDSGTFSVIDLYFCMAQTLSERLTASWVQYILHAERTLRNRDNRILPEGSVIPHC